MLVNEYPDDYGALVGVLQKASLLKHREIILETCQEYERRGEFVRIYPAKGSKAYDKYFQKNHINKIVYKSLFSSEVMPYSAGM